MAGKPPLFADFAPVAKAEWLQKVSRDLKGKSIESLNWDLEAGIRLSPFFHRSDQEVAAPLDFSPASGNDWEIGAYLPVDDKAEARQLILEEQAGGVVALALHWNYLPAPSDLNELLGNLNLTQLALDFTERYEPQKSESLLHHLLQYLEASGRDATTLAGSIDGSAALEDEGLVQKLEETASRLPRFRLLRIDGRNFTAEPASRWLALVAARFSAYLAQMKARGWQTDRIVERIQLCIPIGLDYFAEIARLRALKIVLANVARHYGCQEVFLPQLVAHLNPAAQVDDANLNLIRATTQAMSAVLAGVDRLYVVPANAYTGERATAFSRRMARNVQHLLQLESFMTQVVDPAAGSYYIEELTRILAQAAWSQFQKMSS